VQVGFAETSRSVEEVPAARVEVGQQVPGPGRLGRASNVDAQILSTSCTQHL
jgi:hypothetical protein